jgi:hypothetical protein
LKLRDLDDGLGLFEALEFLQLGIHGKGALWSALGAIAPADAHLRGIDFASLCERAEVHETEVDHWRLKLAPNALKPSQPSQQK